MRTVPGMSALKSEYDAYGLNAVSEEPLRELLRPLVSMPSGPIPGCGEVPRGVLYPDMEEAFASPREARRMVLLSNAEEAACAASIGGVEGGVDALLDGALSRSMASGSNADWAPSSSLAPPPPSCQPHARRAQPSS